MWPLIVLPVALAVVVNAIIFARGWQSSNDSQRRPLLPPGWAVGLIWLVVFVFLGLAHYSVARARGLFCVSSIAIALTVGFCLAYPFVTRAFEDERRVRALNVSTLVLAALTAIAVSHQHLRALPALLPLLTWATYVSLTDALTAATAAR